LKNPIFRPELWQNWSASKINMYEKCRKQFLFHYILRRFYEITQLIIIELIFGSEMHKKFHQFFTLKNGFQSQESFSKSWLFTWTMLYKKYHLLASDETKKEWKRKIGWGIVMLRAFYRYNFLYRNFYNKKKIVSEHSFSIPETEVPFKFSFNGFWLEGKIDRIQDKSVWDYKTGRSNYSLEEMTRDLQFTILQLAFQEKYGFNPESMAICQYKNPVRNSDIDIVLDNDGLFKVNLTNIDKTGTFKLIPVPVRENGSFEELADKLKKAEEEIKYAVFKNCDFTKSIYDNPIHDCFLTRVGNHCGTCQYEAVCTDITRNKLLQTKDATKYMQRKKTNNCSHEQLLLF